MKKILSELGKMDEYDYPTGEYSLFILPDGRMVGVDQLMCHKPILEKIPKRKIESNQEFYEIFAEIRTIRVTVSGVNIYVDISVPCSNEQKYTLEGFYMCSKYETFFVDTPHEHISDAPSENYCKRAMKLPCNY